MKQNIKFIPGWNFTDSIGGYVVSLLNPPYIGNKHVLVGWSLGGMLAINDYQQQPDYYSHLVLISSTPRFRCDQDWIGISTHQADKQLRSAESNMQDYQRQFLRLALHPDKSVESSEHINKYIKPYDSPSLLPDLQTLFSIDLRESFANIKIPVLQIIGGNDLIITPQQSLQSKNLLNHQTHIIPDAGHMLLSTHPEQVANLIQDFLC